MTLLIFVKSFVLNASSCCLYASFGYSDVTILRKDDYAASRAFSVHVTRSQVCVSVSVPLIMAMFSSLFFLTVHLLWCLE